MTKIVLACAGCGELFEKPKNEWTRQIKENPDRKFYCVMSCYGKHTGGSNLGELLGQGNPNALISVCGNRQDKYSAFKYFTNKARRRHWDHDIDLPYLKTLWEQQEGKCALSGIPMILPRNTLATDKDVWNPWRASLDRIDSKKGYLKGNVQFVVLMANLCKGTFTEDDVVVFGKALAGFEGREPLKKKITALTPLVEIKEPESPVGESEEDIFSFLA
ncbi:MAG: hypothetical protein WC824_07900 [Bacteroidota bacterium]